MDVTQSNGPHNLLPALLAVRLILQLQFPSLVTSFPHFHCSTAFNYHRIMFKDKGNGPMIIMAPGVCVIQCHCVLGRMETALLYFLVLLYALPLISFFLFECLLVTQVGSQFSVCLCVCVCVCVCVEYCLGIQMCFPVCSLYLHAISCGCTRCMYLPGKQPISCGNGVT